MLRHKTTNQHGFTLIEIMVVITLLGIVATFSYTVFNSSISDYFTLQKNSLLFGDLSNGSQRIATVTRGLTDITAANDNDMTLYGYFAPNDTYVSLIKYYLNPTKTTLFADVTPMTANPPTGTPITANKKTYVIIGNFYAKPGVNTFVYLDSVGQTLSTPIADLHTIKGLQINLGVPITSPTADGSRTISVQVSLRNRKTNL